MKDATFNGKKPTLYLQSSSSLSSSPKSTREAISSFSQSQVEDNVDSLISRESDSESEEFSSQKLSVIPERKG